MRRFAWLLSLALIPAFAQLACFAVALVRRAGYPMDLEWLEGPQLYEAFRFAHGLPVYGPPAQGFVPCPYPPLFHLVVAAIGRCFGFDYWNGRIVSDATIAVVLVVQTLAVLRAAPSRRAGWVLATMGAAAVAASFRPLEASLDLARVDTMGVALVYVAAWLARKPPLGRARAVAVGLLLCAAATPSRRTSSTRPGSSRSWRGAIAAARRSRRSSRWASPGRRSPSCSALRADGSGRG